MLGKMFRTARVLVWMVIQLSLAYRMRAFKPLSLFVPCTEQTKSSSDTAAALRCTL